jgi:hypothetical protein
MICLYISCRKTDFPTAQETGLTTEARFTNLHRSNDPAEKAIVEYVKRINAQKPFIKETVKRIGYPYWDKTVRYTAKSASSSLVGVFGTTTPHDSKDPQPVNIYYVPFVRDSQNYVNASMVIKTSPTDTSISYLCDWQYQRLPNEDNKLNDAAEYFAIFFMMLDKAVLGHTKFTITNKTIFRSNNHSPREIILNTQPSNQTVGSMYYMEVCENISITYTDCPFIPQWGYCVWGQEGCDNCNKCTSISFYSYCWSEWVDVAGGGGGTGGGDTGGGSTGGGNGGDGAPIPPNPCNSSPEPVYNVDAVTKQNRGKISALGIPCDGEPGWTPSYWTYSGDDGSSFTDSDPSKEVDLQFDAADHIDTQYPNLYQLVKNLKSFVKSSPEVMAALQHWSGFSKQQILDKLTFGSGPIVKVVEGLDGFSSYNKKTGENILKINASWARGLEAAVLPATKQGTAFMVAVSLLHEFVHYGTGQHNINEGDYDFGWGFERSAFSVIVNENNANEISIKFKKII